MKNFIINHKYLIINVVAIFVMAFMIDASDAMLIKFAAMNATSGLAESIQSFGTFFNGFLVKLSTFCFFVFIGNLAYTFIKAKKKNTTFEALMQARESMFDNFANKVKEKIVAIQNTLNLKK